ncbi:24400_t:CDS:1, partial [Cetraspora pellucida]
PVRITSPHFSSGYDIPHFSGFVAVWCSTSNHQANNDTYIVRSVDITAAMERLRIRMQKHAYVQYVNSTIALRRI